MSFINISYHYVSAPAGAGKTYAAIRYAVDMARLGEKVIIAQPSKLCIAEWHPKTKEYAEESKRNPVPVLRFDGDVCESGHILSAIMDHMKDPAKGGEVMFITHAALLSIADWHSPGKWHLIVDEIPAPDRFFDKHLPENHGLLTDAITWEDFSADNLRVFANDRELLRRYARNEARDDIDGLFQEMAQCLLHPHFRVFVVRENLQRSLDGDTEQGKYPLYMFGLLQPSVFADFKSTVIMGANFTESLLYMLWGIQGVGFKAHNRLTSSLRYTEHGNGDRLEVYYLTDDKWSKTLGGKTKEADGKTITNNDIALEAVKEVFGDEAFAYLVNKDTEDQARLMFHGCAAEKLPHGLQGLNCFDHYDNIAAIASFLPPPFHHRFLCNFNLNGDAVRDAVHNQTIYQSITRTSLRDLDKDSKVKVLVTDKHVAEWIERQFEGCAVAMAGDVALVRKSKGGRSKKHANDNERVKAHRARTREQMEEVQLAQLIPEIQKGQVFETRNSNYSYSSIVTLTSAPFYGDASDEEGFMDFSPLSDQVWIGTLLRNRKDTDTSRHLFADNTDQIIEWFRYCHGLTYPDKHDNWLISPALFNPALGDTRRGKGNVIIARGIWLDVDDGELPYPVFQKIFAGIRMAIFNTASSKDDTRYRVFIPTSANVMGDTYADICQQLVKTVQSKGYCAPRQKKKGSKKPCHGIDLGKTYAANMMYLPCQPMAGGASFFEVYDGEEIDPALWVENNILPVEITDPLEPYILPEVIPDIPANDNGDVCRAYAEAVLRNAADEIATCGEGNRNNALYRASVNCFTYANAGLLNSGAVTSELESAGSRAGLKTDETKSTINSGKKNANWRNLDVEALRDRLLKGRAA
jgi:hypothetical protein